MTVRHTLPKLKPLAAVIALTAAQQGWAVCTTEQNITNLVQYNAAITELESIDCEAQSITWTLQPNLILNNPDSPFIDHRHLSVIGSEESPATINASSRAFLVSWGTSELTLKNLIIDNPEDGTAVYVTSRGTLTVENVTFKNSKESVISVDEGDGDIIIRDSQFLNNSSSSQAGAIYVRYAGDVDISNSVFRGNSSEEGGALRISTGDIRIKDSIFENNISDATNASTFNGGGAAYLTGSVSIEKSEFRNNRTTNQGGALKVEGSGTFELSDSIFEGNVASKPIDAADASTVSGGAIWANFSLDVSITNSTFEDNKSQWDGGAIAQGQGGSDPTSTKDFVIEDSQFIDNTALNNGGAISMQPKVVTSGESEWSSNLISMQNSLFTNNEAGETAGALYIEETDLAFASRVEGAILQIENVTFDGNKASTLASAIYQLRATHPQHYIRHSTFTDNQITPAPSDSDEVGVLYLDYHYDYLGDLWFQDYPISHSVFANNDFGQAQILIGNAHSMYGADISYSLLDDQTNNSSYGYDFIGTNLLGGDGAPILDAKLHPLADNGGPTLTRYPMDDSPLIDAGDVFVSGAPLVDQRGSQRIVDTIDIGAVEAKNLPPEMIRSTWNVETGTSFEFDLADYIQDPDNQSMTIAVNEKPSWMTFSANGLSASGTVGDQGTYSLNVTANDGNGFELSATILITVTELSTEPEAEPEKKKKKGGSFGFAIAMLTGGLLLSRRTHRKEA